MNIRFFLNKRQFMLMPTGMYQRYNLLVNVEGDEPHAKPTNVIAYDQDAATLIERAASIVIGDDAQSFEKVVTGLDTLRTDIAALAAQIANMQPPATPSVNLMEAPPVNLLDALG